MESELCQVISYLRMQLAERDAIIADRDALIASLQTSSVQPVGVLNFDGIIDERKVIRMIIDARFGKHEIRDKVVELCEWLFACIDATGYCSGNSRSSSGYHVDYNKIPVNMQDVHKLLVNGVAAYEVVISFEGITQYFKCIDTRLPYRLFGDYIRSAEGSVYIGSKKNVTIKCIDIKKLVLDIHTEF